MVHKGEDIIDLKKIGQLLESYTKATGLVSALLDLEGNILSQSGWQKICTQFHRVHPETAKNCRLSDTTLAGQLKDGHKYTVYKCLNGLIDVAVPIIVNDQHFYNLFIGQFFMETPQEAFFEAQADKYSFDKEEYMDALRQVPIFKESEIENKLLFLSQMTEVIVELGLAKEESVNANIALKESEEKFRALYDNAPLSYQSLNEDGSFRDVNPMWLSTLGYERNEVIDHFYKDFLHPDWRGHFEDNFPAFKKRGYVNDVQFKIQHKKGHYLDISFEGCIGYHPDGSFKQTYCVFTDITERKKTEANLSAIVNNTENSIWSIDRDFNFLVFNKTHAANLYTQFGIESQKGESAMEHLSPEDQKFWLLQYGFALAGTKNVFEYELNDTLEYYQISLNPIYEDGIVMGVSAASVNITERKQAEEEIKNQANKWQTTFDAMSDSVSIVDLDGSIKQHNTATLSLFKTSKEVLKGKKCFELLHGTKEFVENCPLLRMKKTCKRESMIFKEGKRWLEVNVDPIFNSKMELTGAVHVVSNITKRKETEDILRISEQNLNLVISTSPIGICTVSNQGEFITTNQAYEEILAYTKEELIGLSFFDVTHPDDRPKNKELFKSMFALKAKGFSMEKRYMRKDGREIIVAVHAIGIRNNNNEITHGTAFVEDITERKTAEKAIHLSNERYKSLFNDSPIPLWEEDLTEVFNYLSEVKDKGNKDLRLFLKDNPSELLKCSKMVRVLDVNQAALNLHQANSKEQLVGNIHKIFTSNSFETFTEEIISVSEGRKVFKSESEIKTLSGEVRYIDLTLSVDQSQTDRIKVLLATSDITDRKQAEQAILESEKRFSSIFKVSPVPSSITRLIDKKHVEVNDAWCEFTEFSREEVIGYSLKDLNIIDTNNTKIRGNDTSFTSKLKNIETTVITKNGKLKHLLAYQESLTIGGEEFALNMAIDITERKQIEEEKEKIYNSIQTAVYIYDFVKAKNDYINPEYTKMLGWTLEDINKMGTGFIKLFHPDDLKQVIEHMQVIGEDSEDITHILEYRFKHKDGQWHWCLSYDTPFQRLGNGRVEKMIGSFIDITDRKHAEEALQESTAFNETLLNTSPDIIYIQDIVKNKNVYINQGITKILGYGIEDIVDLDDQVVSQLMHPDDFVTYTNETYPNYQKMKDNMLNSTEFRMRHKDGSWYWLHAKESIFLRDADGNPIQIFGIMSDITEHKRAEQNTEIAEKNLQNTFDISPSIICKANLNTGYFTEANKAVTKILGYSVEEFKSKPLMEFIHPDDRQVTAGVISDQPKSEAVSYFENRYLCTDGTYKWLSWHSTLPNKNGVVTSVASDINVRKTAEAEILKYQEHLEDIVKERTLNLELKNNELERFNDLFVDREFRIKELKDQLKKFENLV